MLLFPMENHQKALIWEQQKERRIEIKKDFGENEPASLSKYSSGNSVMPTLGSISIANKLSKPFTFVGTLLNF
ncbi:hypothetical protein X777_00462 [Ooceraea biroi]|uniref:Uncharacterized protein n=1 Tax=Ooceraea biroi TaxID=2015173 RepID=A0A026WUT7_OOCBI|nr:hypothetical protein X777_00462 [Ooceraea biroi]